MIFVTNYSLEVLKMERKSGVLMHISSLNGDYSIGSFGDEAKYFIDFLKECGFGYWQVLPFCPIDTCNSPYKSTSTFGGNLYFVNLDKLFQKGLLTKNELLAQRQQNPYTCEFVRLFHTRIAVLLTASKRIKDRQKIEQFISENPYLERFCEFMALKVSNNYKPWYQWDTMEFDQNILFMWKFIQYEFFSQWSEIKKYANKSGIKIIGDIPIYVDLDSCDVWSNKELFKLDKQDIPTSVAGVPPDYFCADGQLWGNPIYDWKVMKEDNYKWWRDRINHMTGIFDGVRIDHFRGIESFWEIPAGAATAKEGKWSKGPGMELVDAIKEECGDALIIAEDLGDITPSVRKLLKKSEFPGMRVFQFAFLGDALSPHLPHNYTSNCIAYTGTHDNNTLLGYIWELSESNRKYMLEYCGHKNEDWRNGSESIIRTMFASHAGIVIMPIQDLLGYGSDTRLNIPGKPEGNWQYRITQQQLDSIDRKRFRRLNELYSRI
ncbi:MAG: 4-alpha-glucanotransferase [Bacillota bacterium]|nr:4-alpha-glucanotransferase [Bacillota bacterium]